VASCSAESGGARAITCHSSTADEPRDYQSTVPKAYIALAWLWVAVPFGYGVYELMLKVSKLFT